MVVQFKNHNGEPNGILIDNAMQLVKKHIPKLSYKKRNRQFYMQ
jgi:predicted amidohydrolase YtcJ